MGAGGNSDRDPVRFGVGGRAGGQGPRRFADIANNLWGVQPPNVSVGPLNVNFGSVTVRSQSTAVVTVTNTGGAGLVVNSVGLGPGPSSRRERAV